jgi:hypothetical protein
MRGPRQSEVRQSKRATDPGIGFLFLVRIASGKYGFFAYDRLMPPAARSRLLVFYN